MVDFEQPPIGERKEALETEALSRVGRVARDVVKVKTPEELTRAMTGLEKSYQKTAKAREERSWEVDEGAFGEKGRKEIEREISKRETSKAGSQERKW